MLYVIYCLLSLDSCPLTFVSCPLSFVSCLVSSDPRLPSFSCKDTTNK